MRNITTTAGVVLDPFSIHATGIVRKHFGTKTGKASDLHDSLHGEARFKQAFINACHFAESMTVVGPIAQLVWDKDIPQSVYHSLFWQGDNTGSNKEFHDHVQKTLKRNKWNRIPEFMLSDINRLRLHVQPDFSLGGRSFRYKDEFPDPDYVSNWSTVNDLLRYHFGHGYYDNGNILRDKTKAEVRMGSPTLGLMAVIFTFKKPTGTLEAVELTNLASWPPVVFFLPVFMPAGSSLEKENLKATVAYDYKKLVQNQPGIASYRLALDNGNLIKPFGQPYRLPSVDPRGKTPDTLRSLSDVFKALWSRATQYCAWNTQMEFDPDTLSVNRQHPLSLALEPMGAGRRIRGHNRFMGMYNMDNIDLLWETDITNKESCLKTWGTTDRDIKVYNRQLRTCISGKKETIFVLPSYFTEQTTRNLQPLALALVRYMMNASTGLETFIAGSTVYDVLPFPSYTDRFVGEEPRTASFLDETLAAFKVAQDGNNGGALPLHRFEGELAFDPEGDPTVFGLRMKKEEVGITKKAMSDLKTADYEQLVENTEALGNFKFLDAFCSKSTKDLTEVFSEVKEKALSGERGTKAVDMLEDTLSVDLFETDDMLF